MWRVGSALFVDLATPAGLCLLVVARSIDQPIDEPMLFLGCLASSVSVMIEAVT